MSENLTAPVGFTTLPPGDTVADPYTYDHIPGLEELLPQYRGLPGYQYLQCSVVNLRRAQSEGWVRTATDIIYRIVGPKGYMDMSLLVRGQRIPGQSPDSGARLCLCDKSVETVTGLWINPHLHEEAPEAPVEETQDPGHTVKCDSTEEPVWRPGA